MTAPSLPTAYAELIANDREKLEILIERKIKFTRKLIKKAPKARQRGLFYWLAK